MGKIISLNISTRKGVSKQPVEKLILKKDWGVLGDAHAGENLRQISLLPQEAINKQNNCPKIKKNIFEKLKPGDFAENITTVGLDFAKIKIGDKFKINKEIILEVTQIGKECHNYCEIFKKVGNCIMPKLGIFAKVLKDAEIKVEDKIEVLNYD